MKENVQMHDETKPFAFRMKHHLYILFLYILRF